ncbi:hypothetical protein CR513_12087, partial [Mucuna pruriens]
MGFIGRIGALGPLRLYSLGKVRNDLVEQKGDNQRTGTLYYYIRWASLGLVERMKVLRLYEAPFTGQGQRLTKKTKVQVHKSPYFREWLDLPGRVVTWDAFKDVFLEKYF